MMWKKRRPAEIASQAEGLEPTSSNNRVGTGWGCLMDAIGFYNLLHSSCHLPSFSHLLLDTFGGAIPTRVFVDLDDRASESD